MPDADQSQLDEFDPYSLADEQREQETAALRDRNILLELKTRLGDKIDGDVILSARDALVRNGAEVTPEALAAEYNRLRTKFTVVREPHRTGGTSGGSIPPGRKPNAAEKRYPTFLLDAGLIANPKIREPLVAYLKDRKAGQGVALPAPGATPPAAKPTLRVPD